MSGLKLIALSVASLAIVSCVNPIKAQHDGLLGTWKVIDIQGLAVIDSKAQLDFSDEGKVSGNDGCNHITASYRPFQDHLNLSTLASTKMLCSEPSATIAKAFTHNATSIEHFLVQGDHLYLTNEQDETLISLSR